MDYQDSLAYKQICLGCMLNTWKKGINDSVGKGGGQQSKVFPSPISDCNAGSTATIISLQKEKHKLRIFLELQAWWDWELTAGRTGQGIAWPL